MRISFTRSYPFRSAQGRIISSIMLAAALVISLVSLVETVRFARTGDQLVPVEAVIRRIAVGV